MSQFGVAVKLKLFWLPSCANQPRASTSKLACAGSPSAGPV